jgi:hypothetical protein
MTPEQTARCERGVCHCPTAPGVLVDEELLAEDGPDPAIDDPLLSAGRVIGPGGGLDTPPPIE